MVALLTVSLHYRTILMREAQTRTTRLSLLLAEQAARTFESVDFTLRGFGPLLDGDAAPVQASKLAALLHKRAAELAFVQNIRILDPKGSVVATSASGQGAAVVSRDGCVTALSAPDSPPLAIGCEAGNVGAAGQPAIVVARRLDRADAAGPIFIVADLDPGYFSRFFGDLGLGPRAVVTLMENHGHVLLASAEPEENGNSKAPTLVPPTEQERLVRLQHGSGDRIAAAHPTEGYPLTVFVAVDRGEVERQWRRAVAPAALLAAALAGLMFFLARSVERHRAERADARRRALVAQKLEAMGQMTASVAHDFRNILTVMQGTLQLIRRRGLEAAILAEADGTIQRGNAMVDRLLAFSRRTDVRAEPHAVDDLIRHLEGTLRHVAGPGVALSVDLGEGAPVCRLDRSQFDAALMNLVVNARQAMPEGGAVTIRSRTGPTGLLVEVADTGCGIDAATLKRVFEPFFTTKAEHGTGLGLAQVQAFAEQAGGSVTVESTVGTGTRVMLHLPRIARPAVEPGPAAALTLDPA